MDAPLPPGFQLDPALSQQMGTPVAVNAEGKRIRWKGGGGAPQGATARPEYGAGAYETSDGAILLPGKKGGVQIMRGAQTAGAEARTRLELGLGPTIEAQKNLFAEERWNQSPDRPEGSNPNDTLRGTVANVLADMGDGSIMTRASKKVGGDRYQRYMQAGASFESAFMPILSGAAVSPSEAARLIKASLPAPGDSPEILARKAKNRAMMINGAAKLLGQPMPFPKVGAMSFGGKPSGGSAAPAPQARPAPAKAGGFEILSVED